MKIRTTILLVFCLMYLTSNAKGILGSYIFSGKAYNAQGELIRNGKIIVDIKGSKETIKTDSLGNYQFDLGYATACPSVVRGLKRRKANNKINPKFITLQYSNIEVKVKNKWRKYGSKGSRRLNITFD